MPRFQVVLCDPETKEIRSHIVRTDDPCEAVCNHPWLTYVYNNTWLANHVFADDLENCIQNVMQMVGWIALCVNLDEEIMKELNGGEVQGG